MATKGLQIQKLLDYYPDTRNIEIHDRRLQKEIKDLRKDPPDFFTAGPVGRDIGHWEAKLLGPSNSPYSGGVFVLSIRFERYPFFPPEVTFKTKVYHPNISSSGRMCPSILKDQWHVSTSISKVLRAIQSLLAEPIILHTAQWDIARMYASDRTQYEAIARAWTQEYAKDPLPEEVEKFIG